jgi:uncharacterized membrane protein YphA (DoxX/SURF4 family)
VSAVRSVSRWVSTDPLRAWGPVVLRALVVVVLGPAGVLKFLAYDAQVAAFASYGVPAADLLVVVVGVVELAATVAIALGVACRVAALVVVPVMVAAMGLYAVVPTNAAVLVACVGLAALGPGTLTLGSLDSARIPLAGADADEG